MPQMAGDKIVTLWRQINVFQNNKNTGSEMLAAEFGYFHANDLKREAQCDNTVIL